MPILPLYKFSNQIKLYIVIVLLNIDDIMAANQITDIV